MNYSSIGETSRVSSRSRSAPITASSTPTSMSEPESPETVAQSMQSVQETPTSRSNQPRLLSRIALTTAAVWRRIDPSLILENTGSVARDHLAAERTFLAYVRTSLAFASAGVALVQLFNIAITSGRGQKIRRYARPLGATVVVFAMIVLAIGTLRYFAMQRAMTQGKFPAARWMIAVQAAFLAVLVVIMFSFLVSSV